MGFSVFLAAIKDAQSPSVTTWELPAACSTSYSLNHLKISWLARCKGRTMVRRREFNYHICHKRLNVSIRVYKFQDFDFLMAGLRRVFEFWILRYFMLWYSMCSDPLSLQRTRYHFRSVGMFISYLAWPSSTDWATPTGEARDWLTRGGTEQWSSQHPKCPYPH